MLVAPQAKGLFHKAISQSGYTTSVSKNNAYINNKDDPTFNHTSNEVVRRLIPISDKLSSIELKNKLYSLTTEEFFSDYSDKSNLEVPLLTNDGIVIPKVGLEKALKNNKYVNNVPFMAGSNRDEGKLWIAAAEYFVELDYSFVGSILGIPRVKLKDEDSFEAFNYYRSEAWKIRGVIEPISSMHSSGNLNTYAYRYDWDDHRRFLVANFKKLIGASHGTEIPLITGNNDIVGDFGFWSNFAKNGAPGTSSNRVEWLPYGSLKESKNFLILDNKSSMKLSNLFTTYKLLVEQLNNDTRVNELERCVILYQMGTFVGNDIFDDIKRYASFECKRKDARDFLEANANFIEY